jgi:hypothetical protein
LLLVTKEHLCLTGTGVSHFLLVSLFTNQRRIQMGDRVQ